MKKRYGNYLVAFHYQQSLRLIIGNPTKALQLGQDINGDISGDYAGASISLNDIGDMVAIGSPTQNSRGDGFGQVRVFQLANGSWDQLGSDIDG